MTTPDTLLALILRGATIAVRDERYESLVAAHEAIDELERSEDFEARASQIARLAAVLEARREVW